MADNSTDFKTDSTKDAVILSSFTYNTWQKSLIGIMLTFISLFIIVGNLLTLYIYKSTRRLRIPKNYFIVLLALSDLMIGLIGINLYTVYVLEGYWPLGVVMCYLMLITDHLAINSSNFTLVAIAMDRFMSIYFPIQHRRLHSRRRYIPSVILLLLLLGALGSLPFIIFYTHADEHHCVVTVFDKNSKLTIASAIYSYFIPAMLLTTAYFCISYKTTRRVHDKYKVYSRSKERPSSRISEISQRKERTESFFVTRSTRSRHVHANRRGVEFLLFISLSFILTWLPYHLLIVILSAVKTIKASYHLWNFCYVFGWMNSFLNPLCYALVNQPFRESFIKIWKRFKRKYLNNRSVSESSHSENNQQNKQHHTIATRVATIT